MFFTENDARGVRIDYEAAVSEHLQLIPEGAGLDTLSHDYTKMLADGTLLDDNEGFDDPALFAAYLRTLSWNCVTATDPNLFQAPFRTGIHIDTYQLDPLRKALRLQRARTVRATRSWNSPATGRFICYSTC